MSTRKTTAAAAATAKAENTNTTAATTTTTVNEPEKEKPAVMGSNSSTITADAVAIVENGGNESPALDAVPTTNTPTTKDAAKLEVKQQSSGSIEPKRITRNSPLLLTSPTAASGNKAADAELVNSESEDGGTKKLPQIRGRKSLKEAKEAKETSCKDDKESVKKDESALESAAEQEQKEQDDKDAKEAKEPRETKDIKDNNSAKEKETKETATAVPSVASTTNRPTRKAVAHELVPNTRVTRNRQTSTGRPETPPAAAPVRGRRGVAARKMPVPIVEASTKRKRSIEEPTTATAEPGAKYIKIEVKDDADVTEDESTTPAKVNNDIDDMKIKQELMESDESGTDAASVASLPIAATGTTATGRSRGRWGQRKKSGTATTASSNTLSPSTRATRQTKLSSPSPSPSTSVSSEPKRRRIGGNTVTRSSSTSLLKSVASTAAGNSIAHAPDEDSKDSIASSIDTLLVEFKLEKFTPEVETTDCEMEDKVSIVEEKQLQVAVNAANGIAEPLTVDTEAIALKDTNSEATAALITPEASTSAAASNSSAGGSEKAASLSPDLVSEGVSEISVKQFYKKPKFLENNLGIEEDPKLGEIVQKEVTNNNNKEEAKKNEEAVEETEKVLVPEAEVAAKDDELAANIIVIDDEQKLFAVSVESMKEGDLRVEAAEDEIGDEENIDDVASVSSENFSPLVIEEEEGEEEDAPEKEEEDEEVIVPAIELTEKLVVQEDDEMEDDDVTVEESETISMDNNASLHEDALEEGRAEMEAVDEEVQVVAELKNSVEKKVTNEKTKKECDNEKAKLKVVGITKEKVEEETVKIDDEKSGNGKENESSKDEQQKNSEKVALKHELPIVKNVSAKKVKTEEHPVENASDECLENDDVLALIDAQLKKIDEKQSEKKEEQEKPESMEVCEEEVEDKTEIIKSEESNGEGNVATKPLDDESTKAQTPSPAKSSNSSNNNNNIKDDDATSLKSGHSSTDTNSWITLDLEHDEDKLRQKEQHLQNLGLLTHEAAEKRRQEFIQSSAAAEATRASQQHQQQQQQQSNKRNGKSAAANAATAHEYTGTLKTVIKLNRSTSSTTAAAGATTTSNGRKGAQPNAGNSKDGNGTGHSNAGVRRQSLKMTFQKGRARGQGINTERGATDQQTHGEEAYYTIQNENEGAHKTTTTTNNNTSDGVVQQHQHHHQPNTNIYTHGRKSYNRSNNTSHFSNTTTNTATIDSSHSEGHDGAHVSGASSIVSNKKEEKEEILIPEKASSFKFHPGRLCEDQCFYCSGKFGLYDTPCHVGQIKSLERQQKILANEEKLTVDNCLCDACFRHVDRRANVPSYKKRLSAPGHLEHGASTSAASGNGHALAEHHSNATAAHNDDGNNNADDEAAAHARKCLVPDCPNPAAHSLRRKCIRKSVKKFLLNFDMPPGSACVWLCQAHYDTVIQCSGCVLCKRRLGKNHMYHITSDTDRLEKALSEMGIPVQLGIGTAVCKLCRYFANLLMKPPDSTKSQKAEFVKNYRKRLLQFHNIHDGSNDASEADEEDSNNGNAEPATHKTDSKTSSNSSGKASQKKDKKVAADDSSGAETSLPDKQLPSPSNSTGSVECLGMPAATAASNAAATAAEQQQQMLLDNDVMVNYDVPMLSTDSNSSSSPPTPPSSNNANASGGSKLKAILQSASNSATTAAKSKSAANGSDISNVLRANPNISMRELFPGEEDLGLNFKVPFGSSTSQRTPEGWTRVQTFLQYDEPTRRLWEELQKPYGNQSSFLRHLILLEKYYRNGDLILSPHASSNASVYTQTVRQRLTSYDKGHCGGLQSAKPANSANGSAAETNASSKTAAATNIPTVEIKEDDDEASNGNNAADKSTENAERGKANAAGNAETTLSLSKQLRSRSVSVDKLTKQLSTNAVTITARPKDAAANKPHADAATQKSLLKEKEASTATSPNSINNNLAAANAAAAAVLASAASSSSSASSNSRSILKTNLLGINKSVEILPLSSAASAAAANSAANTSGATSASSMTTSNSNSSEPTKQQKILEVANKLLGNQMEAAAAAAAAAATAQTKSAAPAVSSGGASSLLTSPPELVSLHRRSSGAVTLVTASNSAASANTSSATASLINAKRPHLLPKASVNRNAPHNVVILPETLTPQERQQSKSWRPTLMPVEENQHLLNKGGPLYQTADGRRLPALVQVQSGGKPFLISIFDYNRMCILRREKLLRDQMLKSAKNRQELKQQQQMQKNAAAAAAVNLQNFNKNATKQQQAAQQQLLQLQFMQLQKHQQQQHQQQQQNALKSAANAARYQSIAPKNVNCTTTTATNASVTNSFSAPMMPLLANAITNAAIAAAANSNTPTAASLNTPWLWNNFPDANQLLLNGAHAAKLPQLMPKPQQHQTTATHSNASTTPTATITSKQHQQLLLDNTLMSKIPKSLTVIPQHKLMGTAAASNAGNGGNSAHKD